MILICGIDRLPSRTSDFLKTHRWMEKGKWGPFVSHVLYGGGGLGGAPLEHQKQRASIIHISTGSEPLIWPDPLSGSDERRDLLRLTALLNHDVPLHRSKARHPEHASWQENYLGCSSKSSRDPLNYSEDALVLFTHLTLHLDDRRQRWQCSLSRVISGPRYLPIRKICILAFIDPKDSSTTMTHGSKKIQ